MSEDKQERSTSVINLSEIKAKIAALQAIVASVESAAAIGALGKIEGLDTAVRNDAQGVPVDLPEGAFMGKSVPACIELYLSAVRKKKTNKEIAAALKEGGVESNAKEFDTVVAGALFGLKQAGRVLRFKDGWGLAEWYPAHIRGATTTPIKKTSKKKKKAAGTTEKATAKAETSPQSGGASAQERIVGLLRSKPDTEFSGDDVARAFPDIKRNIVQLVLGRLTDARRKVAEKTESGKYRIVTNNNIHQMPAVG